MSEKCTAPTFRAQKCREFSWEQGRRECARWKCFTEAPPPLARSYQPKIFKPNRKHWLLSAQWIRVRFGSVNLYSRHLMILPRKTKKNATHSGPLPESRAPVICTGFHHPPPPSGLVNTTPCKLSGMYQCRLRTHFLSLQGRTVQMPYPWDVNQCRSIFRPDSSPGRPRLLVPSKRSCKSHAVSQPGRQQSSEGSWAITAS